MQTIEQTERLPGLKQNHVERVNKMVEDAIEAGAEIIVRGGAAMEAPLSKGSFYRPTFLEDQTRRSCHIIRRLLHIFVRCRSGDVAYCENLFAEDFGGRRTIDGTTSLKTSQDERISSHFFGQSCFATYANHHESALVSVPKDVPLECVGFIDCGNGNGRRLDPK